MIIITVIVAIFFLWLASTLDESIIGDHKRPWVKEADLVHAPWEAVLEREEIEEMFSDRYPLCTNCVHPESAPVWICEKCGCPTGHYTPNMPFFDVYWAGWLFRSGVDGSIKLTRFRIVGLIMSALFQYGIFFPLYLYRLIQSCRGKHIVKRNSDSEESSFPEETAN